MGAHLSKYRKQKKYLRVSLLQYFIHFELLPLLSSRLWIRVVSLLPTVKTELGELGPPKDAMRGCTSQLCLCSPLLWLLSVFSVSLASHLFTWEHPLVSVYSDSSHVILHRIPFFPLYSFYYLFKVHPPALSQEIEGNGLQFTFLKARRNFTNHD